MLAECDHSWAANPAYYRDTAYLHGALAAGATWDKIAAAIGEDQAGARRRYREWAHVLVWARVYLGRNWGMPPDLLRKRVLLAA